MAPIYNDEEFEHWFLPREGVVSSYVVQNDSGEITDFGSFFWLSSTIVNGKRYKNLKAAYSFYNVSKKLSTLMSDMLTLAKQNDCDVFNALNLMNNEGFLKV